MKNIDWFLSLKLLVVCLVAAVGAFYGQPLIHDNSDASDVLINVFSILAGFLIAVMTIIGEPIFYRKKTWRYNRAARNNYVKSLIRHKDLFHAYLITLALIFLSRLVDDNSYPLFHLWLERSFIFFSVIAFLFSITLPDKLINKQLAKYDDQVEEKKAK
ncbi:hypothetical protein [Halomonas dongshanensis]|uniref:Uncharacterized protein n=1 Tax=Halomonas dongshanensis TaxID=2890835 RepID=A0ABT2EH23_9GAMM|nr:hypothetical protein [Halomonas dongshanensis]MCS2610415.1 hypothetical protein [Halomonas dongshanensis]